VKLTTAQNDRAAGVLLGQGCGDALGVPYEFEPPLGKDVPAVMKGGGLIRGKPGEWSDDTAMAMAIAEVAATGADLTTESALDEIAEGFLRWFRAGPPDVGNQTRAVLSALRRRLDAGETGTSRITAEESAAYVAENPRAAGNGALMRTSPVALAHLDDREKCAEAARKIAALTHGDELAGDSCVLWSEAIRVAVLTGAIDVESGLDLIPAERRDQWESWIGESLTIRPGVFTPNGFTVTALQAALSAIEHTPIPELAPADGQFPCLHLQEALQAVIRIGDDTDTTAAIAGGLLGARWGASAVPWNWRRIVHGWPGRDGRDLVSLAALAVKGGEPDDKGWPTNKDVRYTEWASTTVVPHPFDDGVLLGTTASRGHGATAAVAACRVGRSQACHDGATVVVESRLMDDDRPESNLNMAFVLYDAADAVRGLRAEGHTVFLHCMAAQQRTPSIAIAYALLLGRGLAESRAAVTRVLDSTRGAGAVWEAVAQLV
jgi:ADP-ribosylglycohydrolase